MSTVGFTITPECLRNVSAEPVFIDSTQDVAGYAFGTGEVVTGQFNAFTYGGGNVTFELRWYSRTSQTTGNVQWDVALAAITPGDAVSVEAKSFASASSVTTTVNATAKGETLSTITITGASLDAMANGDDVWFQVTRNGASTISGDVILVACVISYSDGVAGSPGSGDVVGPASATADALARYDLTTGKLIKNSAVICDASGNLTGLGTINTRVVADLVTGPASATSGRVVVYNGATGKLVQNGTKLESDLVEGPASAASTAIVKYSGTTGKLVQNSGVLIDASNNVTGMGTLNTRTIASWVDGPASATDNALARFDTATGKLVQGSAVIVDDSNNITGVGTLNGSNASRLVELNGAGPVGSGNVTAFAGTTGKIVQDAGYAYTSVVLGPASATAGRVAVYNGATGKLLQDGSKLEADIVTGPASAAATSNIVVFNGTTGKIVADGGQTIAQVLATAGDVDGPASAVSGNIASYNGASGKLILDSGVSATAHAARHNVGGADTLFPGTWAADERPEWNGTIWVPKFNKIAALGSDTSFTGAANTFTDVTGLTIDLPRAGTYKFVCSGALVTSGTAGHFSSCVTYTGTVTAVHGVGFYALAGGATGFMYWVQVANGALASTTGAGTATNGTQSLFLSGTITVSTAATLKWQLRRASASTTTTIKASTSIQVNES